MSIWTNEDGNFMVEAPDGHEIEVRPSHTKPGVRFKNVKRPATRLVEFIEGGHQGRINTKDFDPGLHRDPTVAPHEATPVPVQDVTPAPVAPVTQTEAPVDFREVDLYSLTSIVADADAVQVDDIEAHEMANKGRKTVLKAVADRRAELDKE